MPQFSRKRKSYKKSRYSSSSSSSSKNSSASLLRSTANAPETKCQDLEAVTAFAGAGNILCLNGVVRGTDVNQRIGRRICLKGLLFRGVVQQTGAGSSVSEMLRLMLVYDRQTNGANPAVGDIIQDVNSGTTDNMSYMNINNTKRFVVLAKHTWVQATQGTGTNKELANNVSETTSRMCDIFVPAKKIKSLITEFNSGVAGDVTDIISGGLFAVWIGVSGNYSLSWKCRWRWCDL